MKSIQNPNNQSSQITKLIKNEEQNQNITNSNVFISKTENTNQKNYCSLCKKSFSTMGNLRNHIMTIHENQKPFKCPFPNCDKKYSIKSRLQVHYRTHTGSKPFICNFCGKAFNEKGNLKTHERFHSELRPFKCDKCSKTYKTNGHLKDHIEIQHLKIRKFECKYCEKKFGRISTLKAHIRTHTGEKNYKCHIDGCNKFFAEKGNMEIHYKRHLKRIQMQMGKKFNVNIDFDSLKKKKKDFINNSDYIITRPNSNLTLCNFSNNLFNLYNNNEKNSCNILGNNNFCNENSIFNQENSNNRKSSFNYQNENNFIEKMGNNNETNYLFYEQINKEINGLSFNNNSNMNDKNELAYLDCLPELNIDFEKTFMSTFDN